MSNRRNTSHGGTLCCTDRDTQFWDPLKTTGVAMSSLQDEIEDAVQSRKYSLQENVVHSSHLSR